MVLLPISLIPPPHSDGRRHPIPIDSATPGRSLVTLNKIGALTGVDYSAVSISRKRLQASLCDSPQLRAAMARVEERAGRGKGTRAENIG